MKHDTPRILAVIPHYNHETTLGSVVQAMRALDLDCLIVDDGSTAAARTVLHQLAADDLRTLLYLRDQNGGKGAAMKDGFRYAAAHGYSHVLQIDADAQHCFTDAQKMIQAACEQTNAMICGNPIYGADAPKSRLYGRKLTNFWIRINTGSRNIPDGMCGFRLYPLVATIPVLDEETIGERMDFDTEILVHLFWRKVPFIWIDTPVRYRQDGISHFRAFGDNVLISRMHARLFLQMVWRRLFPRTRQGRA
ncbi:MAG: glycosyltransferase family 2 protein [Neisseria sp.]|nr:glycosyltransferase family 2 protein [Neisseria sp.]